jgi:hypothetical protein
MAANSPECEYAGFHHGADPNHHRHEEADVALER